MTANPRVSKPPVMALAGVLATVLAACGGSSSTTTSPTGAGTTNSEQSSSTPGGESSSGSTATGTDNPEWVALDMTVRVINLWHPPGSTTGGAIDVYTEFARPGAGAKKLMTVAPGTASEFVAPEAKKIFLDQGTKDFLLTFYPEGKTLDEDQLMHQSEISAIGLVLTYVILPPRPDSAGSNVQVFADQLGASTGWNQAAQTPPAGKASLLLNASALQYSGSDPDNGPAYLASTTAGKCINYFETPDGQMHTDPNSFSLISGTGTMDIVVDPGEKIRINKQENGNQSYTETCASKPVIPATDPGLAAGARAYGFLWGSDPNAPKLLLVPIE